MQYVLALDQGTTSSRAIVFDRAGQVVALAQREFTQVFPQPGWVEHDAREIWATQHAVALEAIAAVGGAANIACVGITNQRETTLVWDRATGEPIANAIVWQDRRTAGRCDELRARGHAAKVQQKTGLVIDAYFSGTKLEWLLDHVPGARARAENGELAFGTIDSWLVWKLTGGRVHATDASNASRTMLFNLRTGDWDAALLALLRVPRAVLPQVVASSGHVASTDAQVLGAELPIAGIAGDQQAATFGQACWTPGMAKNTYGTGCFMLMNTGAQRVPSRNRLLTTVGWRGPGGPTNLAYCLEGSVFMAGATVQWLRDGLQVIQSAPEVESLAASVDDTGDVYLVPAFAGLGTPDWDAHARGTLVGMTRGTTRAHIARAALEAIALQSADVFAAMARDAGIALTELRVDGGASRNNLLMQMQADFLGVPVVRPQVTETTALGAAYLAGLATGFWRDAGEIAGQWQADRRFEPRLPEAQRLAKLARWREAVERARGWGPVLSDTSTPTAAPTRREELLARLAQGGTWDIAIVGGGATGLGVALDAAARGLKVVLLESHDFAKGTSSRATKLVHGGVRYLAQGNVALVREALRERTTLLKNAPHLAQPLPFVMPSYKLWETPFYGVGLKMYDALAGSAGLGDTEFLSRRETLACLPTARPDGLKGGVKYWDGQFDDARLALALARSAALRGALVVNYCPVTRLVHRDGKLTGVLCRAAESGREFTVRASCVVNATGVWVDELRKQDSEATGRAVRPMVAPSQGVHAVVGREFLPGTHALMVPKTSDGRVLFGVPWMGKLILGTTDTPRGDLAREPRPFREELDFILGESARYLVRPPRPQDIRSLWVGLRPLVKPVDDDGEPTKALSREHTVLVSKSGLVTVTGGKWTTYRAMAEDVLEKCFETRLVARRPAGVTADLPLVGAPAPGGVTTSISAAPGLHLYGTEAGLLDALPGANRHLGGGLTAAMVRFAARHEYARTVEDVLARRLRLLFLDADLAASLAAEVGSLLLEETGVDPQAAAFRELAQSYVRMPA